MRLLDGRSGFPGIVDPDLEFSPVTGASPLHFVDEALSQLFGESTYIPADSRQAVFEKQLAVRTEFRRDRLRPGPPATLNDEGVFRMGATDRGSRNLDAVVALSHTDKSTPGAVLADSEALRILARS